MHLPIGISSFRELVTEKSPAGEGFLFVDKTLFIKDLLDDLTKVIVVTRPRRFGKTLTLSMLQHFFAAEVDGKPTAELFNGLAISQYPECIKQQGQYPVIFISLKDIKEKNFELCLANLRTVMAATYRKYSEIFESAQITANDRNDIAAILNRTVDQVDLSKSIQRLIELLNKIYNAQPILLIDEYDTPIQEAYLHGYYDELIGFFRNFLSAPLKDENALKRAILTGILRVSKESLFSSLNNVEIYSVLNKKYANYFGFTEAEVSDLLTRAKLPADTQQTKEWYNGYNFGGTTIYNPWSIIKFIKEAGVLKSYWINTSGNEMVKNLIINSSADIQASMRALISGQPITQYVDEHIVFGDLNTNPAAIWSLLIMAGYLKYLNCEPEGRRYICSLMLPNKEIADYYCSVVEDWLSGARGISWYKTFIADLADARVAAFEAKLQTLILEDLSCHDVTHRTQEAFYHGLMLAFAMALKDTHIVKSNKESGSGFYDVAIIPKDLNKLGIVMAFKAVSEPADQKLNLQTEAKRALKQINKSNYISELQQLGISKICCMGIAFSRKAVKIAASGSSAT